MSWYKALVTRESLRLLARAALLSLAYFISARMGVALLSQPLSIASFWPPSGLLVGVLARSRQRPWSIILLAVIPANIMANLLAGKSLAISCAFALINCVANGIGAWLLVHFMGRCARCMAIPARKPSHVHSRSSSRLTASMNGHKCANVSNGANSYAAKPVDLGGFMHAIQRLKDYWFEVVILPKGE